MGTFKGFPACAFVGVCSVLSTLCACARMVVLKITRRNARPCLIFPRGVIRSTSLQNLWTFWSRRSRAAVGHLFCGQQFSHRVVSFSKSVSHRTHGTSSRPASVARAYTSAHT